MALYDCFTLFNELDLLEVRLNVLADVVDTFVIVEADRTFQGAPKPLHFAGNADRFAKFAQKIVYVPVSLNARDNAWELERAQRNALLLGLRGCRPGDSVAISDVDEIPNPAALRAAGVRAEPAVCRQRLYYYYVNLRLRQRWYGALLMALRYGRRLDGDWLGTAVVRFQDLLALGGPQAVRDRRQHFGMIEDAGWHWSYLGGIDALIEKVKSFSHTEANTDAILDRTRLERALREGRDFMGRWYLGYRFETTPIDESYPRFLRDHAERYAGWIRPG
jgi:beta-1,4-mannosyl-glycoprotein beta-1,4-N-acetylglucosaminyltransferase